MIAISRINSVKVTAQKKSFEQVSKKLVSMVSKLEKNRLTTLKENVATLTTIASKDLKVLYDAAIEVDTLSKDLFKHVQSQTDNESDNEVNNTNIFLKDTSSASSNE